MDIIEKAKKLFYKMVEENGSDPYSLLTHLPIIEKWAKYLLSKYPEADKEVVLLAVWLHDIGHYPIAETDHAITGEILAKKFLEDSGLETEKIEKVARCVRRHRNKDIVPDSIEEKIIAFSDSASHITDMVYLHMISHGKNVKDKIERDFKDLSFFPEIKEELIPLYEAWKKLIPEYEKVISQLNK